MAQHNAQSIELESKKSREGAREPIGKDLLGSLFSMEGFGCASLVLGTDTEVESRHTESWAKGQIRDGMGWVGRDKCWHVENMDQPSSRRGWLF